MDSPPVPKPRTAFSPSIDPLKRPVPLPRTNLPSNNDKVSASDIFRSITSVSKQITEDVALKVSNSAKTANEKLEKSIADGSKFARGTLEKTLSTSRAVRNSVIEGTKTSLRLRKHKKPSGSDDEESQRCVSMPVVDVSLFDNIQFNSPLLEQKKIANFDDNANESSYTPSINSNELSLMSSNSDSNTDTLSMFSYDSRDDNISSSQEKDMTYDTPRPSRANSVVSILSAPEAPERRKKDSGFEIMRQNSMYENWTLPHQLQDKSSETPRVSKSTIYEFDPLNTTKVSPAKYEGVSNELLLLESFLIGDTYATIVSTEQTEETFDFVESDYFNPPTPPERTDSLFPETDNDPVANKNSNSKWFDTEEENKPLTDETTTTNQSKSGTDETKPNNSVVKKFSHMLKLDIMLNKSVKPPSVKPHVVERPPINTLLGSFFSGMLTRIVSGVVEDLFKNQTRHTVLSDLKLMCYTDPTNSVLKEVYMLDSIYSLQIVLPLSSSTSNNSYCFELMLSTGGVRHSPRKILFSCTSASERRNWAQKIAEHLTNGFSNKYTSEFTRCGWCYLKEGVTGEWRGAWVLLIRRVLVYYTTRDTTVNTVDLKKTRCVVTQEPDEETKTLCPNDGSASLLLDCPHATLYMRFPHEKELKGWRYMIKLAAHNNGPHIHHQQLTKDNVPALVDKCLSFIYAHGSLTEGIYRRAGSSVVLSELLGRFRRDAWSVQLAPGHHSEHDVAGVLKRFFRDLPEPLVPQDCHNALVEGLRLEQSARHIQFRNIMNSLPLVVRNTIRKLFAHLHFIHTMAHANKMNAENLASVWAPTIMPAAMTSSTLPMAWSTKEVFVVRDLIANFEMIWEPTETERRREAAVRRVLMRVLSSSAPVPRRAAGDLRAWVYVTDRTTCHQVALTPNKTSADVCVELWEKANLDSHLLMIEEVICNEAMRRIVHMDEIVLDVVLRWGYWDEDDRKDNYLVIKENKILHEMDSLKKTTSLVCGELKFANESSKSFKLHMFEFQNSKLCYFKDKQGSHKLEEWDIKDILWYMGHEPKRNPQSRWAITFIPKNNKQRRSKEHQWFGCTIAGAVTVDQLKWTTAMMFAEHSEILPIPRLIIT